MKKTNSNSNLQRLDFSSTSNRNTPLYCATTGNHYGIELKKNSGLTIRHKKRTLESSIFCILYFAKCALRNGNSFGNNTLERTRLFCSRNIHDEKSRRRRQKEEWLAYLRQWKSSLLASLGKKQG